MCDYTNDQGQYNPKIIRLTQCFIEQFLRFFRHRREKIPKQVDSQSKWKDGFEEEEEGFLQG
jgi:hypothetical protein